ncbi:Bug family tripartite tricarboxylate transporter substrate binding protein [Chloroflexota bacterium]
MQKWISVWLVLALGLTIALGACEAAPPEKPLGPAEFYKGKTVQIVTGQSVGGAYDLYARLLAPYLEKRLDCDVLVKNIPGAGGSNCYNYLYEMAPQDGSVLSVAMTYAIYGKDLLGAEGVRWHATEFNWIAQLGTTPAVMALTSRLPCQNVVELQKEKGLRFAATGIGSTATDMAAAVIEALGLDAKIIVGYDGSTETLLGVLRGEAELCFPSEASVLPHVKTGDIRPIAIAGGVRSNAFPDVPLIEEQVTLSEQGRKAYDFRVVGDDVKRTVVAPPNVPEDRVAFLREVFKEICQNEEVAAETAKLSIPIVYLSGAEVAVKIAEAMDRTPEEVEQLKHVLYEKPY